MRRSTAAIVTVGSSAAIGASWLVGLSPAQPPALGLRVVAGNTRAAGTPTSAPASRTRSGKATRKGMSHAAATPTSGHVDGAAVDTQYGTVQVRVAYTGHRITDVIPLHLTDSSGTSVSISASAEPVLRQEAVSAQSAHIDMVSGATYTSEAYLQSLQSAIDAAHLS